MERSERSGSSLGLLASLLDALDRPLIVSDRCGLILYANVRALHCFGAGGTGYASQINLITDLLRVDGKELFTKLESGEQEVRLNIENLVVPMTARVRWLPEPDWIVTYMEPAADHASAQDVQMRQTVQDLMQEREVTYRNLLAAYLRLQEVNRQKTVFLASAAHELKTPLAVMKGYYDLLLSESLGEFNERQREILQESKESCDRLVRLVSMFLNYSALESGKLVLQLRENNLNDCLSEVVCRWQEAFQRARVQLETRVEPALPIFPFDYPKVQQCMANLLDNAIKHTPAGGKVILTAETHFWERRASDASAKSERRRGMVRDPDRQPNSILLSVRDTGAGISAEYHQEIFEEFVRVDPSSSGMGLGLAITKRLIQAHRGKIWVDSEPGCGSMFTFILPLNVE